MARDVPRKFLVAFSFAGEQRDLVHSVAKALERFLGEGTVFYDEWYEHYIAGHDADTKLQEIYAERAVLVITCVSEAYGKKLWTQSEHEAIRVLLMNARTSEDKTEQLRVLPLRVGDGDVKGIPANAICPDIRLKTPSETATLIVNRLRLIEPEVDGVAGHSVKKAVRRPIFLAECTPDMDKQRDRMKAFLEDLRWPLLPESSYSDAEFKTRLAEDLNESFAFVQVLGPYPWKRGAFDRIQYDAAKSLKLRRFCYRSSELDLKSVDGAAYQEFLAAEDFVASGFEDFKSYVDRELKILQHQSERSANRSEGDHLSPLVRVVIRSPNPDPLWDKVFHWIYDQEKILADQMRANENLVEKHLADPCQGVLVVCDAAALEDGPYSTRKDMEQCRQIQLKEKNPARRPPVGLVYWPPPDASWARLLRCTPNKLYCVLGDSPRELDKFFAEVRMVGP